MSQTTIDRPDSPDHEPGDGPSNDGSIALDTTPPARAGDPSTDERIDDLRREMGRHDVGIGVLLDALSTPDALAGRIALLAAGTDGEDGPTDAAGAFVTEAIVRSAQTHALDAADYLARNDAYNFFQQVGGLFMTGPTQMNVCDLRIVVVDQR